MIVVNKGDQHELLSSKTVGRSLPEMRRPFTLGCGTLCTIRTQNDDASACMLLSTNHTLAPTLTPLSRVTFWQWLSVNACRSLPFPVTLRTGCVAYLCHSLSKIKPSQDGGAVLRSDSLLRTACMFVVWLLCRCRQGQQMVAGRWQ